MEKKPEKFDARWNLKYTNVSCNQYSNLEEAQVDLKTKIRATTSALVNTAIGCNNIQVADSNNEQTVQSSLVIRAMIDDLANQIILRQIFECP